VLLDGLIDLGLHDVVAEATDLLPKLQEAALIKFDVFRARRTIDILDDVTVAVLVALARLYINIVTLLDPELGRFRA
jgi:hypothetical protein